MKKNLCIDDKFSDPNKRIKNRKQLDKIIADAFIRSDHNELLVKLKRYKIAYGILNNIKGLEEHVQLRKIVCKINNKKIEVIAPPAIFIGEKQSVLSIPQLGEHSKIIREEYNDK